MKEGVMPLFLSKKAYVNLRKCLVFSVGVCYTVNKEYNSRGETVCISMKCTFTHIRAAAAVTR